LGAWLPGLALRTGQDNHVAIGVPDPHLPVLWRRVDVRLLDDGRLQPASPLHSRVEIIDLKPKQDAVPRRRPVPIHEVGMLLVVLAVKLENQRVPAHHAVVDQAMRMIRIPKDRTPSRV
jgi:hypothetical protein